MARKILLNGVGRLVEPKAIAAEGVRLDFSVSLGKDSAAMLHLMSRFTNLQGHSFFTWLSFPEPLPYQRRYLGILESLYHIKVEPNRYPETHRDYAKWWKAHREANGCGLTLLGWRKDESLQRLGALNKLRDGIDRQFGRAFPLRSFTSRQVMAYVKANRIPVPVEYSLGLERNLDSFFAAGAWMLRHLISERDYQCAVEMDPQVEIEYIRYVNDPGFGDFIKEQKEIAKTLGYRIKGY